MSKKEKEQNKNNHSEEKFDENEEDFVIEEDLDTEGTQTQKLRKKIKKLTEEKQEYLSGWQRARAELVNAKKDFLKEKEALIKYSKEDLILQIIPVLDSFEIALLGIKVDDEKLKDWVVGTKHIYSQLLSVLENNGVKQVNPLGEIFDHTKHNSVESIKVDDEEGKNIIVEVVQKGYEMHGKLIREAKVKVSQ